MGIWHKYSSVAYLAVIFLSQTLTAGQTLALGVICASVVVEATWARLQGTMTVKEST
ncbi:MAG: hypothetical protein ACYTEW_22665 [Planctomycetota bacterium]|jgi:hypothetical protein